MSSVSSGFLQSGAVSIVILFLLLLSSAGSVMTYVIIVIANRADPDPTGKRPMAAYLFGGSFVSLWIAYMGSIIVVEALVSLLHSNAPSSNTVARMVVVGFLMVLVGGVTHVMHRQRGLALSDSETDPSSPTKRVMRSYVAAVSFISVLIAIISAMVFGYLIFQLVAPGVFGLPGPVPTRCRRSSIRCTYSVRRPLSSSPTRPWRRRPFDSCRLNRPHRAPAQSSKISLAGRRR